MAIDIILSKNTLPIHNGSIVVICSATGFYGKITEDALSIPVIENIESKYDNRFDDVNYYMGGGSSDGGYYTGDVLGV